MSVEARQRRAAWLFLAPSLALIAVFFVLPVAAGLLLSLTDFDIYAVADPSTMRFTGLQRFADLPRLRWPHFPTGSGRTAGTVRPRGSVCNRRSGHRAPEWLNRPP